MILDETLQAVILDEADITLLLNCMNKYNLNKLPVAQEDIEHLKRIKASFESELQKVTAVDTHLQK